MKTLMLTWIFENAAVGGGLLTLGCLLAALCRSPIRRLRLLEWTLVATLVAPVFASTQGPWKLPLRGCLLGPLPRARPRRHWTFPHPVYPAHPYWRIRLRLWHTKTIAKASAQVRQAFQIPQVSLGIGPIGGTPYWRFKRRLSHFSRPSGWSAHYARPRVVQR